MRLVHSVENASFRIQAYRLLEVAPESAVVVISFTGFPADKDMETYAHEYRRVYKLFPKFLTVYDTRNLGLPNVQGIQRAVQLIHSVKSLTMQQVHATLVLTQFDFVRTLVSTLVHAGGQVAPFRICTTPQEISEMTLYYLCVHNHKPPVFVPAENAGAPSLKTFDSCVIFLMTVMYMFSFVKTIAKLGRDRLAA